MAAPGSSESGSQAQAAAAPLSSGAAEVFLLESRRYLISEYPAKLERAITCLDPDDLWWRPGSNTNSVGHLLRHLAGNVRQWVVHGIGGRSDVRDRAAEFAADPAPLDELLGALRDTLAEADIVLLELTPASLMEARSIQGVDTTVHRALYHVVEHFSMHTGQVLWVVKARTGTDLDFYRLDDAGRVLDTTW